MLDIYIAYLLTIILSFYLFIILYYLSIKENVMPSRAEATVNHRIHPTSNLEEVLEHDRWAIGDDRVKI